MDRIQALLDEIKRIEAAQKKGIEILQEFFPPGCRVEFSIRSGQENKSTGSVIGHVMSYGIPVLRVTHDQAKPMSRYRIRNIDAREATRVERFATMEKS